MSEAMTMTNVLVVAEFSGGKVKRTTHSAVIFAKEAAAARKAAAPKKRKSSTGDTSIDDLLNSALGGGGSSAPKKRRSAPKATSSLPDKPDRIAVKAALGRVSGPVLSARRNGAGPYRVGNSCCRSGAGRGPVAAFGPWS